MAASYRYYGVLLPLPLEQPILTYRRPADETAPEALLGRVVLVPLGIGKAVSGVVWSCQGTTSPLPAGRVKGIRALLDYPPLPEAVRLFWSWVADYYMCSLGDVLRAALPSAFRPEGGQRYRYREGDGEPQTFTLKELRERHPDDYMQLFSHLVEQGLVVPYEQRIEAPRGVVRGWGVGKDPGRAAEALKRSRKSLAALERLTKADPSHFFATLDEVAAALDTSAYVVGRLRALGAIVEVQRDRYRVAETPGERPADGAEPHFGEQSILLLHRPGSRVEERLPLAHLYDLVCGERRQVLLLLPSMEHLDVVEAQLESTIGDLLRPYHMGVTPERRQQTYLDAWRGRPGLYVGLRAAVWLPLPALREVVILDGEHRGYRQWEPAPRFTASDAALVLAMRSGARALLVSAHPSAETMAQVLRGKYALQEAAAPAREVPVEVGTVALQRAFDEKRVHARLLSDLMVSAIRSAVGRSGRVLLLYRRPGCGRAVECEACGKSLLCPRCGALLRPTRDGTGSECPVCGYRGEVPARCPHCGKEGTLRPVGTGICRLAEAVRAYFRGVRVAVEGESGSAAADIILSTAYDPPLDLLHRVAMVGVVQLDLLLTLPDYRAGERAYRLLSDCRSELPDGARLVVQYFTKSVALDAFVQEDYRMLAEQVLEERHRLLFPPFCRLLDLVLEGNSLSLLSDFARRVYGELSNALPQVQVLEPTPLPVSKREVS